MRNWINLLAIGILSVFGYAQQDLTVNVLNLPASGSFQTYSKVELGIELPEAVQLKIINFFAKTRVSNYDKVNPFLDWDLNVVAVFRQEESNKTIRVPAFYFRDFKRDTIQNRYIAIDVKDNMRVRFAPPVPGTWTVRFEWSMKSKPQISSANLSFNVLPSASPGYVKVHENRRNFQLGDSVFYPIGVNFPSPMKDVIIYHSISKADGSAPYGPNETHLAVSPKAYLRYLQDVQDYIDAGGKYIRTLQSAWGSLIEFEEKGNYVDRMHYAWEQDHFIELCAKNDVYVQFNLLQQEPFMKYGNYDMFDWDWSHYDREGNYHPEDRYPAYCYANGDKKQPHEMFMNEIDLMHHEQRLRYYIARYGYSRNIYLFELLSEPWHLNQIMNHEPFFQNSPEGITVRKAVLNYQTRMAKYMRTNLQHAPQLIGVDMSIAHIYDGPWGIDSSIYIPEVDVIGVNPYSSVPEKLVIQKSGDNNEIAPNENTMRRVVNILAQTAGKPVIISEGGAGDAVDEWSEYAQQKLDMATFGLSGLAGYNSWLGWSQGQEVNWPFMIVAQNFVNSQAFKEVIGQGSGKWIHGVQAEKLSKKDKKRTKELQYYVAESGSVAVGYVKNRSYNFWTKAPDKTKLPYDYLKDDLDLGTLKDVSSEDGKSLIVEGLAKGKRVKITWYDAFTGKVIADETVKWKRKFILRHPDLVVTDPEKELPLCWFSIRVE